MLKSVTRAAAWARDIGDIQEAALVRQIQQVRQNVVSSAEICCTSKSV